MRKFLLNRGFVGALAVWAAVISFNPSVGSAMPSESLSTVQAVSVRQAQVEEIMQVLSMPQAQLHLRMMGLREADVREGLSKLDDAELAQVASRSETVKAGGDGLGIVIAVLVIVLLVIVILSLTDKKIEVKDDTK